MKFTKMQGTGNDYVYVDTNINKLDKPNEVAIRVSDRHFGIGSDGLVLISYSLTSDFKMRMFNSDGTESEMCGNAIRCVGKYVYDKKMTAKTDITVETKAGVKYLKLYVDNGEVVGVKVDMGAPIYNSFLIPTTLTGNPVIGAILKTSFGNVELTAVSMGNPHACIFVSDLNIRNFEALGREIECNNAFPNRVNVEFIKIIDENNIEIRVWERGAGETLACGTGACAAAVAAKLNGFTKDVVTVKLLGGELLINITNKSVFMTGDCVTVFEGDMPIK